jgi:hypothetical protein
MPPLEVRGAGGWQSGYVVPVIAGALEGTLTVDQQVIDVRNAVGYHDHNWGFWEDVSWRWGQTQHAGLSLIYGRIFPPRDAADPDLIPGFLALTGPDGPIGYAVNVTIEEENQAGSATPRLITITARSSSLDLTARFAVSSVVTNTVAGPLTSGLDFLQMRGTYSVQGTAAGQRIDFEAQGSAETFRAR